MARLPSGWRPGSRRELFDSLLAGLGAGLFLAFSYTFWIQAVTAEVYTLHLLIVGAADAGPHGLGRSAHRQGGWRSSTGLRLGFGNHLSMVLLLPAFALFLLMHRRCTEQAIRCGRGLIALARSESRLWARFSTPGTSAACGQTSSRPLHSQKGLAKFWFDVTKADWRETLVMSVSETGLQTTARPCTGSIFGSSSGAGRAPGGHRVRLCAGALAAAECAACCCSIAANMAFAWTYNVGDAYIFFLPSHYVVALCGRRGPRGCGMRRSRESFRLQLRNVGRSPALVVSGLARIRHLPAVDRSWDTRAESLLREFTARDRRRVRRRYELAGPERVRVLHARARRPYVPWFATEELPWLDRRRDRARARR